MELATRVKTRLATELQNYEPHRWKIRAEILLQRLVDDGEIDVGDCRRLYSNTLECVGLEVVIQKESNTKDRFIIEF